MAETSSTQPTVSSPAEVTEARCAFCGGKGRDPFGILSRLATCPACSGTKRRRFHGAVARCAYCHGTGRHPSLRMRCLACGGAGVVEAPDRATACPACGGSGRARDDVRYPWHDSIFPCGRCGGRGLVAPRRGVSSKG